MAKKKKKGGKGGKKKAKAGLSALEKKTFFFNIRVLETKLRRKENQCFTFRESRKAYLIKYEEERKEKEDIVKHLKEAIEEARNAKDLKRNYSEQVENKQQVELEDLEFEIFFLEAEMIFVGKASKKENDNLRKKLDLLEGFKSEIDNINRDILRAENELVRGSEMFNIKLDASREQARTLVHCLRQQLVSLILEKSCSFQESIAEEVDPSYVETIRESIRLEGLLNLLSERLSNLKKENSTLEGKLRLRKEERKVRIENGKKMAFQLKIRRQMLLVLREKQQEQNKKICLLRELRRRSEAADGELLSLQNSMSKTKEKINTFRNELVDKEALIKAEERRLSHENKIFRKLEAVIAQAQALIGKEVISSLGSSLEENESSFLEDIFAFFSSVVRDTFNVQTISDTRQEDTRQAVYASRENGCFHTYTPGNIGILHPIASTSNISAQQEHATKKKDIAVQTEGDIIFDSISAYILADIGLLNKFEKSNVNRGKKLGIIFQSE